MRVGRPKIVHRRLCVGLLPEHSEYIDQVTKKTGRYDVDIVREALDLLIVSRPARRIRRSTS